MSKKIGISLALVLSVLFTVLIWHTSTQKLRAATETEEVLQATKFIPVGQVIKEDCLETVEVPAEIASNLVKEKEKVLGRPATVSLLKGQYIYLDAIGSGVGRTKGCEEIYIPTDLSSSAFAIAGEYVNVHLVSKAREAQASHTILENVRVTHCLDQNGYEITPERRQEMSKLTGLDSRIPVSIAIEVPPGSKEKVKTIVQAASQDLIYLTKTGVN